MLKTNKIDIKNIIVFMYIFYASISFFLRGIKFRYLNILYLLILIFFLIFYFFLIKRIVITTCMYPFIFFWIFTIFHCIIFNQKLMLIYSTIIIMFYIMAINVKKETFEKSLKILGIMGGIYALGTILQRIYPVFFEKYIFTLYNEKAQRTLFYLARRGRYSGFTTQVGHTAGYISFTIGIIIAYLFTKGTKRNLKISLVILFYALLLTGKRAHFLFTVVSLLGLYIISYKQKNLRIIKRLYKNFLVIIFLIPPLMYVINKIDISSSIIRTVGIFKELITYDPTVDITSGRLNLYDMAWNMFKEKPIFGWGWGKFTRYMLIEVNDPDRVMQAHNVYIQLLAETGMVGFLIFLIMIITNLFVVIKKYKNNILNKNQNSLFLTYTSLFIQFFFILYCMTGNPLYDVNYLFIYIFGVIIGIVV